MKNFPSLTMDAWEEEKHPRRPDGKFGKGGGENKSTKSQIEKITAKIEPSPNGINKLRIRGFANKQKLNNHWQNSRTHKEEYPNFTKEQYVQRAIELIEKPVGKNILGHIDKDGAIIRYDRKTNDL